MSRRQPGLICDRCWELLATSGTVSQRADLAVEPALPGPAFDLLADDSSPLVRAEIAGRDDLDDAMLQRLAGDPDQMVGMRVVGHVTLPAAVQARLLHSPHVAVLAALAVRADMQIRTVLLQHPDPQVRAAAADGQAA